MKKLPGTQQISYKQVSSTKHTLTEWSVDVIDGSHHVHVGNGCQLSQCLLVFVTSQHGSINVINDEKDVIVWV